MKIVASLIILGLCASAFAATPVSTSQSGSVTSSLLNSTATKVFNAANQTDAAIWNTYALTTPGTTGVPPGQVVFGPGTTNETAYVYGYTTATNKLDKIYRRTLNATIVGWGNDTTLASVTKTDETITSTTPATGFTTAVGPGYLAILSTGSDGTNEQVYLNIVSSSASEKKITTTLDIVQATTTTTQGCTQTTYGIGNVWYDIGAGAFFYTYWKKLVTETAPAAAGDACTGANSATATTVWLGAHYLNGTAYLAIPGISVAATSTTNAITALMGGGDNWLNATNIFIMYRDATAANVYYSKTAKATTTTALGSFSSLVADDTTADATKVYTPIGVWTSNYTYGMAVACKNQTAAAVYNYPIWNYLNGTTSAKVDSGLSYTSVTDNTGGATSLAGWPLTTGYTLVGAWTTATASTPTYQFGTFYGNGTVNTTAATLATLQGPVSYYQDVNGTMWIGWTDVDTANTMTYAGYLAKLQGQINVAGANALSTILAFVALFLASIFAF